MKNKIKQHINEINQLQNNELNLSATSLFDYSGILDQIKSKNKLKLLIYLHVYYQYSPPS